jgi:hypothetical protein
MMSTGSREPSPVPPAQHVPRSDAHADAEPESPAAQTGPRTASDGAAETRRSGPLIAKRYRKADGRLLILYTDTSADG